MDMSPFTDAEIEAFRAQLPAVHLASYLNAGTFGPIPHTASWAMDMARLHDEGLRHLPEHWSRLSRAQKDARAAVGRLTGLDADQIALMHSTHEGLNTCVWGLGLRPGDNVVVTDEDHPGLLVPLRHARAQMGLEVRVANWRSDDEEFVSGVLRHVDANTRAVALTHVSWVSGRVAPIALLAQALPDHVRLIVDGAQSAGILPIDPAEGWDAYTISGQKWPCGPSGSGALALVDPESWQPAHGAFMQVEDPTRSLDCAVVAAARRFETSQETIAPLVGLTTSISWLLSVVGIERAAAHARACNAQARRLLAEGGLDPAALHGHAHLLAVDVDNAPEIATALYEQRIIVRSLSVDRLRISFGFWTMREEIKRCVQALIAASAR